MGLKKGQASEAFKQGKMDPYNILNKTPEERREFALKGCEARKKKAAERKAMKEQLQMLLEMDVTKANDRKRLKELGISDNQMNNQMLLMTSLFRRGLMGDVQAIKQINEMVESLGDQHQAQTAPVINIYSATSGGISVTQGTTEDEDEWDEWAEYEDDEEDWPE